MSIRDVTAFLAFLAGWMGSAAFSWPYLVVGWETGHFTGGVFRFLVIAFGTATLSGIAGLALGGLVGAVWEHQHRVRRARREAAEPVSTAAVLASPVVVRQSATSAASASIRFGTGVVTAGHFLALAGRVWPRAYDGTLAAAALSRTTNIGAWDGDRLVGTVRVLTDGYFFATVPEILVDPDYRHRGIGRELMRRALHEAPSGALFFGAQPESVGFFERLGCDLGPTGFVMRRRDRS